MSISRLISHIDIHQQPRYILSNGHKVVALAKYHVHFDREIRDTWAKSDTRHKQHFYAYRVKRKCVVLSRLWAIILCVKEMAYSILNLYILGFYILFRNTMVTFQFYLNILWMIMITLKIILTNKPTIMSWKNVCWQCIVICQNNHEMKVP